MRKLLAARVLWRPDEQSGVKLSPKVRDLIAEMLADETRRHVNADRLRQEVDGLNGRFADAIDSLWQRLNSDFGFVSQLNDKIRENDAPRSRSCGYSMASR